MYLFERFKSYVNERAAPVFLLWFCIAVGYTVLPPQIVRLLDLSGEGGKFDLPSFVDPRLLLLLGFGFVALLVVFAIVEKLLSFGAKEHANRSVFFDRLWDEISGAASHVAFGTISIWFFISPPKSSFPWVTVAWLGLALFAFKPSRRNGEATA